MPDSTPNGISQVLAEIQAGGGRTLSAVGRRLPGHRGGKSVNPSTIFRWVKTGAKSTDGRRVKLEAARVGGRWLTSEAAVGRFVAALTSSGHETEPLIRTPAARNRASEAAGAVLEQHGA